VRASPRDRRRGVLLGSDGHTDGEREADLAARILVYMIAEYARHNGYADLLRERIDGATRF
jgi:hypothetical protein